MKNILAEMGAVYTRREIRAWVREQRSNHTEFERIAEILNEAYKLEAEQILDRRYMIVKTASYPKRNSAKLT